MMMYGVAILAFSYLVGQFFGDLLGGWLGIKANVGGVGFAMVLLLSLKEWFQRKGWLDKAFENGIDFWNKMYIPVVIAMSATQNVKVAVSSGFLAIVAGIIPTLVCFLLFPFLIKKFNG